MSTMANIKSMCPTFSIIIPHKDIPNLLMRCLKSIPVSEDVQVIVVDDNSPDADTYLETYPELSRPYLEFIRTTKGGGAGYARNVGLDHAKGKWLLFADADDFFVDNAFDMIRSYENCDADVVYFKKKSVYSDDLNRLSRRNKEINVLVDGYIKAGNETELRVRYWVPWGKLIRKELVDNNNFRFDEVKYSNDQYFGICVGLAAPKITADERVLYVVTTREGSLISGGCMKPHEIEIRAEVCFRSQKLLKDRNIFFRPMPFRSHLLLMLKYNKGLCGNYLKKIDEIYPSRSSAMKDMTEGYMFLIKFGIYCSVFFIIAIGIVKDKYTKLSQVI